jgi:predicted RNase H-like HicB family nuclease
MSQAMTTAYFAILHKDPDSAVGVVFPDLPGCYSAGDTYDEAICNASLALHLYADAEQEAGRALPQPRSFEDLFSDRAVRQESLGAAFVAIQFSRVMPEAGIVRRASAGSGLHRDAVAGAFVPLAEASAPSGKPSAKARRRKPSAA